MSRHGGTRGIGEVIGIGGAIGAVAGAWKLGEALHKAKKLEEVHLENQAFVSCAQRAIADLKEAERLLKHPEIRYALSRSPEKTKWIEKSIKDCEKGVQFLVKYTRRVNKDVADGKWFGIRNRLRWVLDEHDKALHARMELDTAHLSLLEVISFLGSLEPLACCEDNKREGGRKEVDVNVDVRREFVDERGPRGGEHEFRREVRIEGGVGPHEQEANFRYTKGGLGPLPNERQYVDEDGNIVVEGAGAAGARGNVTYREEYEVHEERPRGERVTYRREYDTRDDRHRGPPPGERVVFEHESDHRHRGHPEERVQYEREYRIEEERPRGYRGPWPPPSRL